MQRYIIKSKNIEQLSLFFHFLVYICIHENFLYRHRNDITGIRHYWNLCTSSAYHPFLLLSAAFYFRGSPRLYRWLIQQKQLGPYIKNFREYRAIPLRAKIISLSLIWITLSYCIFQIAPYLWLKIILLAIAIGTTWHILSYKTLKK